MDAELWQNQVNLWKAKKDELGITFDELADRTKISIRQLYYLFGGKAKNPGVATVHRVNNALGLTEDNDKKAPTTELSEGEKALLDLFKRVPAEQQELVLQMIRVALGTTI